MSQSTPRTTAVRAAKGAHMEVWLCGTQNRTTLGHPLILPLVLRYDAYEPNRTSHSEVLYINNLSLFSSLSLALAVLFDLCVPTIELMPRVFALPLLLSPEEWRPTSAQATCELGTKQPIHPGWRRTRGRTVSTNKNNASIYLFPTRLLRVFGAVERGAL